MNNQGWIHYWRNSLADADSAKGALKKARPEKLCANDNRRVQRR